MSKILVFGHKNPDTDTIMSSIAMANLEKIIEEKDTKPCRLGNINKETQYVLNYFDIEEPELLKDVQNDQNVILVDHNEFTQSVDGIENAKIIRVVDHHKIAGFKTSEPLYYTAMPVGSTATIIYDMYKVNNIEIEYKIAGAMLSAIISDTLLFKSPTCTPKDVKTAKELEKILNIDINKYGIDMLKAGTDLSDFSAQELINIDSKTFEKNGIKYQVAQVNTVSINDVLENKKEIEEEMIKFIEENNEDMFLLLITDILESNSQIITVGERKDIVEKAFNVKLEDNMAYLAGVVSRKKQVVPVIEKCM